MEIHIDRTSGIPIYIQIKKQIKGLIDRGILEKGDRLPPERELAEKIQVSRNRVSTAYKELEQARIITLQQGKGTFVAGKVAGIREASRKDKLLKIIDLAMEEAISLGFSLEDFLTIAYVRAKEKEDLLSKIKVVFVECSQEQLSLLMKESELDQQVASIPLLISKIQNHPAKARKILDKAEIIVTTPFHLEEVENFVSGTDKQIIDMTLEPKINTIVELARIGPDNSVGLVCLSDNFAVEVVRSLEKIGLNNLNINHTTNKGDKLKKFVEQYEVLITSPPRYKDVLKIKNENQKVISFDFAPDRGSVNMLKMALIDIKETIQ